MAEMIGSTPPEGYAGCCEAVAEWDFEQRLAAVRAPTLVVACAADEATPPLHSHAIASRIVGARVVIVEDAAHVPIAEQPRRISDLIIGHLAAGSSGGAA
jgi:3-oxoadipate enol-lactonase